MLRKIRNVIFLLFYFKNGIELLLLKLKSKKYSKCILKNGIIIESPQDNNLIQIIRDIFKDNIYNPSTFSINANDVVVDVGANVGVFSIFAATKTNNSIHAFEPFPENFKFLKHNIYMNGFANISPHCAAISNKNASEKLYISRLSAGHLLFDHTIYGKLDKYIEVPTKTIEQIMEDYSISKIDFLKLDCEGSEGYIFKNITPECLVQINKIAMEFHDHVSIMNHEEIKELLENNGFVCSLNWSRKSPFGYLYARKK